jgi:hypothetical protein
VTSRGELRQEPSNGTASCRVFSPRLDIATTAAEHALVQFERGAGPLRLPVCVDRIAAVLGYQVLLLFDIPMEISGVVCPRERLIGVNGRHHPHRRRFTVGHELGHVLLGHPPESRCGADRIHQYNLEADRCASALLIPERLLLPVLRKGMPLAALAELFDVSPEAMTVAMERSTGKAIG